MRWRSSQLPPSSGFGSLDLQEVALGIAGGEIGGALVGGTGFGGVAEFGDEAGADGVVKVLRFERVAIRDAFEGFQGLSRAADAGKGHATVHRDDGRGLEEQELVVKTEDARPIGAGFVRREAMTSGDAGFEMVGADRFAGGGRAEGEDAFLDESRIPLAAILML